MGDDLYVAVIVGLTLIPVFGTILGWYHEPARIRLGQAGICPACGHPEHWPWCKVVVCPESRKPCWCDLFTEPPQEDDHVG